MNTSPYQFLNEVISEEEVTDEFKSVYPWIYSVSFGTLDEENGMPVISETTYQALNYDMLDQVEKRWRYDYGHFEPDLYLYDISLVKNVNYSYKRVLN